MKYKKSQVGWIVVVIFVPLIIFLYLAYVNQWGNNPIQFVLFLLLTGLFILLCGLFYKLTIELNNSTLKLTYGIGLIRIKFQIDKLIQAEVIKNPWYYGFGIRITPKGMLYNIQSTKAVNIKYVRNGKSKSVMVGTPEPEQLKKALEEMMNN